MFRLFWPSMAGPTQLGPNPIDAIRNLNKEGDVMAHRSDSYVAVFLNGRNKQIGARLFYVDDDDEARLLAGFKKPHGTVVIEIHKAALAEVSSHQVAEQPADKMPPVVLGAPLRDVAT